MIKITITDSLIMTLKSPLQGRNKEFQDQRGRRADDICKLHFAVIRLSILITYQSNRECICIKLLHQISMALY